MKAVIIARDFSEPEIDASYILKNAGFEVKEYDTEYGSGTTPEKTAELIGDADAAIVGLEPINDAVFERCPNLKVVSRRGIGYDSLDLAAFARHGAAAVRTTGAVEGAVAEHVMACVMHFARRLDLQARSMRRGEWNRMMTYGAKNRTLGLIGFGGIGKEIARRADGFGMEVLYNCRHPKPEWESEYNVRFAPLDELLRKSDYISINVPLTAETEHMIDARAIGMMKREAVIINIARSRVVDETALAGALREGRIKGACIDVYDSEPCTDSVFRGFENVILTPHTANFTTENIKRMNELAAENIVKFFDGTIDEKYVIKV